MPKRLIGARKGGRDRRPPLSRGSLALFGLQFRESIEDERVGLVGQLGDEREVITAEAVGGAALEALPGRTRTARSHDRMQRCRGIP